MTISIYLPTFRKYQPITRAHCEAAASQFRYFEEYGKHWKTVVDLMLAGF